MYVKKQIKICKENLELLRSLPAVRSVVVGDGGRNIKIRLHDDSVLHKGDYLVQFASGLWQRFGAVAVNNLVMRPSDRMKM